MSRALVMGASGFLGSHVVKELVAAGRDVRILVRATSDTRAIDHLQVERHVGGLDDESAIAAAMDGCETVYYCIVDTRAWLRDPTPLYETNVEGLRRVMDIALAAKLKHFVFTSTFGTIGINSSGISTEADSFNWWDRAPHYIRCRVEAENLFMSYCRDKGLPGVACCVGNTYGPDDVVPTPHGQLVRDAALGKMPAYWDGGGPSVGIADAARALVLAEENGKVGERYIIAQRWVSFEELFGLAASHAGQKPAKVKVPLGLLYLVAAVADVFTYIMRRDNRLSVASLRCATMLPNVDSSKAQRELGWQPEPIEDSIAQAVDYYLANPEG
jgi:nucleoside-diphosphate-sugar epimerase